MSDVKRFFPENRLRKLVNVPGAVAAIDALRRVSKNLEAISEISLRAVDAKIAALEAIAAQCEPLLTDAQRDAIHRLANEIYSEAGSFGQAECSQAAYSLCDLVTSARTGRGSGRDGVTLHVAAMKTLRAGNQDNTVLRRAILDGLRALSHPSGKT